MTTNRNTLLRYNKILRLRKEGITFREIGSRFGISKQRVEQIVKSNILLTPKQIKEKIQHVFKEPYQIKNRRMYNIYACMKQRCNNEKHKDYKHYGARGIRVLWNSFEEFETDMLPTYFEECSIERIDNNKSYSKDNCKWIPQKEQTKNRRPVSEWNRVSNYWLKNRELN